MSTALTIIFPAPTASPVLDLHAAGGAKYYWEQFGIAVATIAIIALGILLASFVIGGFLGCCRGLRERRERRRLEEDEVVIELAVQRPNDIAGRRKSDTYSGETLCVARNL